MSKKEKNEVGKEKIPVTFSGMQVKLIEEHKGLLGNTKAEIVRNIVINWLIEREKNDKSN